MVRVEVYGKPDCPLCDEAKERLGRLQKELRFELVDLDVTRDPAVKQRYENDVPVVFVDGRKAFKHRFSDQEARKRIERALARAEGSQGREAAALPPRTLRRVKVAFVVAALIAIPGVLALKAWDVVVTQPALAEEAFEISRPPRDVPAPDFRVETSNGGSFSLADAKGQVVFLNFWATWCPPCREEMPSMVQLGEQLSREHPGRFKMVAVSVDEGWDPIKQFFGGRFPPELLVTLDRTQDATRAYYCAARGACPPDYKFPETYVIDRTGKLAAYVIGPRDWSEPAARRFLSRLIDG